MNGEKVGQETADVGAGHGGSGDGIARLVTRVPGGEDVKSRGENVNAFPVVGEVGAFVAESGGTDGHGVHRRGG